MSNQIAIKTINSPAIASAFGYQESDLTDGASLGFPVLSYRGKVWRINSKGNETPLVTPDGDPIPSVRLILLKANPNLSKIYYAKNFSEGDSDAPDCWSLDGEKPDSQVSSPQCATCGACPKAAWGSKISDDGKELKACQDSRRLVVVPCNDVSNEALGGPMLLRVPAASLGNLVAYDDMLKKANAAYFGVATKVSFDMEVAYPKLKFEYDGASTEKMKPEDGTTILELRDGDQARRILQTQSAQEHGADAPAPVPAKQPVAPAAVVEVPAEPAPAPVAAPEPVQAAPAAAQVASPVVEGTSPPTAAPADVVEPAGDLDVDALVGSLLNG